MAYSIETLASTRRKRKETSRVESLIPSGLRDKSAALIELLKSYYEYMNLPGNPSYEINSINNSRDIDLVDEKYLTLLQKEIAAAIPKNVQIDKVKLYKSLLQYYSVRGSVDSIRLFFKILFQDNVQVYYPREDMLIPSSGNWDETAIRPKYVGNTLVGSQGIQFVQAIQGVTQGVQGIQFIQGIQAIQGVQSITQGVQGIQFIQSIQGISDRIPFIQGVTQGVQGIQQVTGVQGVTGVQAIAQGVQGIQQVTGVQGVTAVDAPLPGGYIDNKGFLSNTIKLQDSYFYQQFSYVIQTGNNTDTWKNEFNRLVHPAGFIFFGQIVLFIENVNTFPVDIIYDLDKWLAGKQSVNGKDVDLTLTDLNLKLLDIIDGRDNVRIYSSMHDHQPGLISDEDLPVAIFVGFAESLTDGLSGEPFNRKDRCVAATTANITLSGPQTIDGRAVIAGDRVLVKNQTVTSENGIYQVKSGAWTRTTDADVRDELVSAFVFIPHGSVQHRNTAWVCTIEAGTIGTATMIWNQSFVIPQAMIPFTQKVATGYGATATATVSNGGVTGLTVTYLTPDSAALQQNESYSDVPSVVFSGGGGTGATATATLLNGIVTALTITNAGSGYSSAPAVTIVSGTDSTTYLRTVFTAAGQRSPHKLGVMTAVYDSTVFKGTHLTLLFDQVPIASANSAHPEMLKDRYRKISHFFDPGTAMHTYADYSIKQADTSITDSTDLDYVGVTGSVAGNVLTVTAVTSSGTGYTSAPAVSFTGGGGTGATATATLTGTAVTAVTVATGGINYTNAPTVSFTGGGGGSGATATATASNGIVTGFTVTAGGSGYTSAPTVTILGASGAAATAIVSSGAVIGFTVTAGGSGYTSAPTVTIAGPGGGGTTATATATLTGNAVTGLTLTSRALTFGSTISGTDITVGTKIVSLGTGRGSTGTYNLSRSMTAASTTVTVVPVSWSIPVINVGSLISNAATFTGSIASTTLTVTAITEGTIHIGSTIFTPDVSGAVIIIPQTTITAQITGFVTAVTVTTGGTGYASAPDVTITGGGGSGATATATINGQGVVTGFTITSPGSGYTGNPTVTIAGPGGGGTTATATAISAGTYTVSNSQTVASITMTAITPFSAF